MKNNSKDFNLKSMLGLARQFRDVSILALEPRQENINFPKYMIPGVVNYCFSIELFLKFTLIKEGNFKGGHKLHLLFLELSDVSKRGIIKCCFMNEETFIKKLEYHSNHYDLQRYFFESNTNHRSIDGGFLVDLCNGLNAWIVMNFESSL